MSTRNRTRQYLPALVAATLIVGPSAIALSQSKTATKTDAKTPATSTKTTTPPKTTTPTTPTAKKAAVPVGQKTLRNITPEQLSIPIVQGAIKKTVDALYKNEPNYTFHDEDVLFRIWHSGRRHADPRAQQIIHEMGNHALACWALLRAGESYQNPRIRRRLNWVLASDAPYAYDRGMRAQMLEHIPSERWGQWIRRDALWLTGAMTTDGTFPHLWTGDKGKDADVTGDHANSQYGTLGLWSLQHSGYPVPLKTWEAIDKHWRGAQDESGGWSTGGASSASTKDARARVSGPMTAGGVAVLSLTDRFLNGPKYAELGKQKPEPQLQKGLDWLDKNFTIDDKSEELDFYYYMWTMQQVGHLSGYRTFNKVDWFRQVTTRMLNLQGNDGKWTGPQGEMLSTGFALLYLARANDPLAVCKVRHSGNWNNRPHDLLNFVEWGSDEYEVSLFWQIVDATMAPQQLAESRMLYLASDKPFDLKTDEVNGLRDYVNNGGILIISPEGTNTVNVRKSGEALCTQMFGDKVSIVDVPEDHWLMSLHRKMPSRVKMSMVTNGIRPLAIIFHDDIARDLQINNRAKVDAFVAMSNIYLYVTGKDFDRPRLETNYLVQQNKSPKNKVLAARIRHAGNYDPEPNALKRLAINLADKHDTDMQVETLAGDKLAGHRIAFLTATGDAKMSDAEIAGLRTWIEKGGTLWIDAGGGSLEASRNADEIIAKLAPNQAKVPLSESDPIISGAGLSKGNKNTTVGYRPLVLQRYGQLDRARLLSVPVAGRQTAIIVSGEDLTAGLAGLEHWGVFGYTSTSATNLVSNGVLSAAKATATAAK